MKQAAVRPRVLPCRNPARGAHFEPGHLSRNMDLLRPVAARTRFQPSSREANVLQKTISNAISTLAEASKGAGMMDCGRFVAYENERQHTWVPWVSSPTLRRTADLSRLAVEWVFSKYGRKAAGSCCILLLLSFATMNAFLQSSVVLLSHNFKVHEVLECLLRACLDLPCADCLGYS